MASTDWLFDRARLEVIALALERSNFFEGRRLRFTVAEGARGLEAHVHLAGTTQLVKVVVAEDAGRIYLHFPLSHMVAEIEKDWLLYAAKDYFQN
jgi:hypothetical protein